MRSCSLVISILRQRLPQHHPKSVVAATIVWGMVEAERREQKATIDIVPSPPTQHPVFSFTRIVPINVAISIFDYHPQEQMVYPFFMFVVIRTLVVTMCLPGDGLDLIQTLGTEFCHFLRKLCPHFAAPRLVVILAASIALVQTVSGATATNRGTEIINREGFSFLSECFVTFTNVIRARSHYDEIETWNRERTTITKEASADRESKQGN